MNQEILFQSLKAFAARHKHKFDKHLLSSPMPEERVYGREELPVFVSDFLLQAALIEISAKVNYLDAGQMKAAIQELSLPMVVVEKTLTGWIPVVLYRNKKDELCADRILAQGVQETDATIIEPANLMQLPDPSTLQREDKFVLITALPWRSMVSYFQDEKEGEKNLSPVRRLIRLLGNEKRDIWYIYVYAMVIGLISLSLPIGIQTIINLISGGRFFNSIIILISLVIIGVLVSGGLQIMQMTMVEILQRRIFAKASFELAFRVPRFKMEALTNHYPPELMNRFFEIVNIQKGLPKLLIDISAATLQIVFGLMLLAFYHPFFVIFAGFLVAVVFLIFRLSGNKGLETNIKESTYKYKMAQWFEELARTLSTFKLAGTTNLPLEKTDYFVNKYLIYRKKHFGVLILQYGNILAFKTLVTAGILVLGTILVVDRQITLGQFVASELVIIIVVAALEKIVLNLDVIYELLTAVDKLGRITDLPLENPKGFVSRLPDIEKGLEIEMKDLKFRYLKEKNDTLKGVSFRIPAGARFCITGYHDSGKETLMRLMGGIYTSFSGSFTVNQIPFANIEISHYRDLVSKNFDRSQIFDGTILENITMGKPGISFKRVTEILQILNLSEDINRLPDGILTQLVGTGNYLSNSVLEKIILARCLVVDPALLLISYPMFMQEKEERIQIYQHLLNRNLPMTVGFLSNETDVQKACDMVIVLDGGQVKAAGPYDQIKQHLKGI
jgi:ABC-type bacteriocin/lantibiotic exporter with double-glycine peptidase domain